MNNSFVVIQATAALFFSSKLIADSDLSVVAADRFHLKSKGLWKYP